MGSLLVISYDQSKLVYQAMILRGYHDRYTKAKIAPSNIPLKHWIACGIVIFISFSLMILQLLIKS